MHARIYAIVGLRVTQGCIRADRRGTSHVWLIAIICESSREGGDVLKSERELSLRMNEAGCRAIFSRQSRQTAIGCACMYCAAVRRPKIIYRRVARAARGAASDNGAFRDRDRAGSSLSSPSCLLDYRSR